MSCRSQPSRSPHAPEHNMLPTLRVLATLAVPAALAAQSTFEILALTDAVPLLARIDPNLCTVSICPPALPPVAAPYAGGVAHDPRDRATWISDGLNLMKVDVRSGCTTVCAAFPAPNLPLGVVVTGLACNEETQRRFISHSNNVIHTYGAVGCSLTLQSSCTLTLPSNHMVTGLATDDANQLIFIGSSPWNGPGPVSEVNIALQAAPCVPVCFPTQVVDCSGFNVPFITGLGYDPCRQSLVVSDPSQVTVMQYLHPCGGFLPLNCCSGVPGQQLTGLCVLPSTETSSGSPCFSGSSPACLAMRHLLRGDPAIGNLGFALELSNCPTNSIALAFLDIGSNCAVANHGLCSLMPTLPLWASMTFVPPGLPCTGAASFPMPLPNFPALCGLILSTRWSGWMVGGGPLDHYVSNCVTWMISGT